MVLFTLRKSLARQGQAPSCVCSARAPFSVDTAII